jgi:hypothetical protein
MNLPGLKDAGFVAMIKDIFRLVGNYDHRPVFALFEELDIALIMKAAVADRYDFVNQEAIKLDGE